MEHDVNENNYEELLKTGITNTLNRSEEDMLEVADSSELVLESRSEHDNI
jgi:hypothetical protein